MKRVAVIGAGAAGCFCAAWLRDLAPELSVTVFEAGPKPLAKVAITGGGRCNLTNSFEGIRSLKEAYPRGERVIQRALKAFSQEDTVRWFTAHGVPCVLQEDHCWFPKSQNAMDVVNALLHAMSGAELRLRTPAVLSAPLVIPSVPSVIPSVPSVIPSEVEGSLLVNNAPFDFIVYTPGGIPKGFSLLDLDIVTPVPSLFTFTVPDTALRSLMGLVVEASIGLQGTSFRASGPLLITDWGFSGPATLKLSSYAARHLAETGYKGTLAVNWLQKPENEVREQLTKTAAEHPQKLISSVHLLPQRLWEHIVKKAELREDLRWAELGSKGLNKLVSVLTNDNYPLAGKSKFREEFVTAGGVAIGNIDLNTLECKKHPGLYFAGEVLDIDAITGGFNLQAAWSTGYVCARSIVNSL